MGFTIKCVKGLTACVNGFHNKVCEWVYTSVDFTIKCVMGLSASVHGFHNKVCKSLICKCELVIYTSVDEFHCKCE